MSGTRAVYADGAATQRVVARIEVLRRAHRLSQEAFARRCRAAGLSISRAAVANLLTRRSHMTVDELCGFAAALDVEPCALLDADAHDFTVTVTA